MNGVQAALLSVRDITKNFGGLKAVDVSRFDVSAQEIRGVIGPNGAGKTTFFDLITGRQKPNGGEIYLDGVCVTPLGPDRRTRLGMVRSFQVTSVFFSRSVHENVSLALRALDRRAFTLVAGGSRRGYDNRVKEILYRLGLRPYEWELVEELGHGSQRLVEIAIGLALEPRILFLDEPAAGMAAAERDRLVTTVKALREDFGVTIVMVEHDVELMMSVADSVSVLHQGSVLMTGSPEEIANSRDVQDAYLGKSYATGEDAES